MTSSDGVWRNFRGAPCVWSCITPIGRQRASGFSALDPAPGTYVFDR